MKPFEKLMTRFFPPIELIEPGIYHYQAETDQSYPYRLHLRVEDNGEGTLILNASTVLHLNQTATEYAYHIIHQTPKDELIKKISYRYNSNKTQIENDYNNFLERLDSLVEMPDLDPVTFLGFERSDPYSSKITAPFRLDCALTYRTSDKNGQNSVSPVERVERELSTEEWKKIMDKAWNAGIPQIIFTGGEPTLRDDLVSLISHAEKLGQVTGLLTDGLKLIDVAYINELLLSGLDHLMIVLDMDNPLVWQAIETVTPLDIHTTVHLTLTPGVAERIEEVIERLASLEINAISLSVSDPSLKNTLQHARERANEAGISLKWDLPVPYSNLNPVSLEIEENAHAVDGAGTAWLYIEPDGDVLAAQGLVNVLGNMLTDEWKTIWENRNG